MATPLTLLILAVQLLTILAGNPNLPQSFRDAGVSLAHTAIAEATLEMSTTTPQAAPTPPIDNAIIQTVSQPIAQPSPTPSPTPPQQTLGTTQPTQPMPAPQITVETTQEAADTLHPFGHLVFITRILDANGKTTTIKPGDAPSQPISMTLNGNITEAFIDSRTTLTSTDFFHSFDYTPTATGTLQFTFTSGSLTKDVTVTVN